MQTTLTKKQRREIYLKAAKRIGTERGKNTFIKGALRNVIKDYSCSYELLFKMFPEVLLFQNGHPSGSWYWSDEALPQTLALLFAAEFTKDN